MSRLKAGPTDQSTMPATRKARIRRALVRTLVTAVGGLAAALVLTDIVVRTFDGIGDPGGDWDDS